MFKYLLSLIISFSFLQADTDASIYDTKNKVDALAKEIQYQKKIYTQLDSELEKLNETISLNQNKLVKVKKEIKRLDTEAIEIKKEIIDIEQKIVDSITTTYSASLGLNLAKRTTKEEIVEKEVYTILANRSKYNVMQLLNKKEELVKNYQSYTKKQILYQEYITIEDNKIKEYSQKKSERKNIIQKISKYHDNYKKEFDLILESKQNQNNLLVELNILNKENILLSENKTFIQIKTIAPIPSYKIVKSFGKYYDEIYKKEFYSESVTLKSDQKSSKIFNILNGKVFYIGIEKETNKNIIIIQHQNNIFSIYSNIDFISDNVKINDRIRKGTIIGVVNDTLIFKTTKDGKYLNPLDLF